MGLLFALPFRVHSWGGAGSQLFAYLTFLRIASRFPNRKIVLVHHTSGVTNRPYALGDLIPSDHLVIVDDYAKREAHLIEGKNFSTKFTFCLTILKDVVRIALKKFKVLVELNTNQELEELRPWTISSRGHYSQVSISPSEIELLAKNFLGEFNHHHTNNDAICLHWRLDDLQVISTKKPISLSRLILALEKVQDELVKLCSEKVSLEVMSDSPAWALNQIKAAFPSGLLDVRNLRTNDLREGMREGLKASHFVGTNSKISIWIILFRLVLNPQTKNILCWELEPAIRNTLDDYFPNSPVEFY